MNHVLATAPHSASGFALTQNSNSGGGALASGVGTASSAGAAAAASLASTALSISSKLGMSMGVKSPKRQGRYRRLPELRHSASMSPKKSPNPAAAISQAMPDPLPFERIPDSFRVYRANNQRDASDSDDAPSQSSSPCSSCSDFSMSGSCSDFDSDEASDADGDGGRSRSERDSTSQDGTTDAMDLQHTSFHHGQGNNGNMAISSSSGGSGGSSSDDDEEQPLSERQNKAARIGTRGTPTPTSGSIARGASLAMARGRGKRRSNLSESTSSTATPPPLLQTVGKLRSATPNASPLINNIKARRNTTVAATTNNNRSKPGEDSEDTTSTRNNYSLAHGQKPTLEPLQLVWAKCRGYPWYPALILDPKTPKGFVYNGVPLPAPPSDVLALRKNCLDEIVFLVLFFDVKRTWQWLPANKLDLLGIDKQLDQQKLVESRKPAERKAVKKAYQDALHYQSQVSDLEGQGPDPIMWNLLARLHL